MIICGVELKGSEANICLLGRSDDLYNLPDCKVRRLPFKKVHTANELKAYQREFAALMQEHKVDKVVIRERPTTGKFTGGAMGFKLAAAIQLAEGLETELMNQNTVKDILKVNTPPIDYVDTGLKGFQEHAFLTAFAWFNQD